MASITLETAVDVAVNAAVARAVKQAYEKVEKDLLPKVVTQAAQSIFPVGSYWITESSLNPGNVFGGEWKKKGAGRCLWGADASHSAGSEIEPGLPNITGKFSAHEFTAYRDSSVRGEGALYPTGESWFGGNKNSSDQSAVLGLDASRSNSLYGKSSTVQPPALVVNIWVRIA